MCEDLASGRSWDRALCGYKYCGCGVSNPGAIHIFPSEMAFQSQPVNLIAKVVWSL